MNDKRELVCCYRCGRDTRYGLMVTVLPSRQENTPDEVWISRFDFTPGKWLACEVNSEKWHMLRGWACGIPNNEIDPKFHERQGYNKRADRAAGEAK